MENQRRYKRNWWDSRNPNSFFPKVYRAGDDSLEGYLDNKNLTVEDRTKRECDIIESQLLLKSGNRILDCPCGYGRHSIELAKRGYDVTGIDLCPQFIEEANQAIKNLDSSAKVTFIQGDMRRIPHINVKFEACINMFFSFGFFEDKENIQVLKEYYKVLKPDGQLLIHTDVNPDRVAAGKYGDRSKRTLRNGKKLFIEEYIESETNMLRGKWTIKGSDKKILTASYAVKIYSHEEMNTMLKSAGFSSIKIISLIDSFATGDNLPQEIVYVAKV